MKLPLRSFVFISGFTSRAQCYAQELVRRGLKPDHCLFFGDAAGQQPGQQRRHTERRSLNIRGETRMATNFAEPLIETARRGSWSFDLLPATNVNSPEVFEWLSDRPQHPHLIVYSGYGAQLVSPELLDLGTPWLHIHSGLLPDYRGSTTLYYSWLREGICGVSAIFLRPDIDKGPIVARRRYPTPPADVDPDHIYDGMIRADLLGDVLADGLESGSLMAQEQPENGTTYYVVHPVLKHLARLRTGCSDDRQEEVQD